MANNGKLMEMLTTYAAAHQHPMNIFVHMLGIPTIMLGVLIPLSWIGASIGNVTINLAEILVAGLFLFYLTLDRWFAAVFLVAASLLAWLANYVAAMPVELAGSIAALAFFGGYAAQFAGHAIEKSMPALVRHPIQANLAAPFFTVVELCKFAGLREQLFNDLQRRVELLQGK